MDSPPALRWCPNILRGCLEFQRVPSGPSTKMRHLGTALFEPFIAHCTEELRCSQIGWARDGGSTCLPSPRPVIGWLNVIAQLLAGDCHAGRLRAQSPSGQRNVNAGSILALADPMICLGPA